MKKNLATKISLVTASLILVAILFVLPKIVVSDEEKVISNQETSESEVNTTQNHSAAIPETTQKLIDSLRNELNSVSVKEKKLIFADSLAELFKIHYEFDSSSKYLELALSLDNQSFRQEVTGKKFLSISKLSASMNRGQASAFARRAIALFDKILDQDPGNVSARTQKAIAIVYRNTSENKPPVEGLQLLKAIIEEHPDNIEAKLSLGEFYLQRGQIQPDQQWLDKAAEQFKSVLTTDPRNINSLLYLVETYLLLNDKDQASFYLSELKKNNTLNDLFINDFIDKCEKKLSKS